MTSVRNPGGPIELAVQQRERRAEGTVLAPEQFNSVIIDQKGPLAAQGSLTVSSLEETHRRGPQGQGRQPDRRQILHLDESGLDPAGGG